MPFYYRLRKGIPDDERAARGLLALKEGLREQGIPSKDLDDSLLLATWNIREFDSDKYGRRSSEALHYIAEIVSSFDLVAVQEIREDLSAFRQMMQILGPYWKYIITDMTLGTRGNMERMAFVYDSRKVSFQGLAGEIVIPPIQQGSRTLEPSEQLYRTPYIAAFKAGWYAFCLCTVHIMYGTSKAGDPDREAEIRKVAQVLADLQKRNHDFGANMILLGDFNIFKPSDVTFKAITDAGFHIPESLQKLPSNALKNKHYDQIAFISQVRQKTIDSAKAGVFDFFDDV